MKYQKSNEVRGKWVKGSEVASGSSAKLVAETKPVASQFKNKDGSAKIQNVSKIQIDGQNEALNININQASLNALIDAFGEDSVKWQANKLTIETEKVVVGGKRVVAVYLIPEGYEMTEDTNGYVVIVKSGESAEADPNIDSEVGGVGLEDLPF